MKTDPAIPKLDRALYALAALIAFYSAVCFGRVQAREWVFFSTHAAQASRILRLPKELAQTNHEILAEERELARIQREISRRLGRK